MEQLSLFGLAGEKKSDEEKSGEEKIVIAREIKPEDAVIPEMQIETASLNTGNEEVPFTEVKDEDIVIESAMTENDNSMIVFEDEKIAVKIKKTDTPSETDQNTLQKVSEKPEIKIAKRGRKSFKEMDAEIDLVEIPGDEVLFEKKYYSIGVVSEWFHVNPSLLRLWTNEFDILKPKKNGKGDRYYRPEDVKNLQIIYSLLRQRKFTVEGAKEYLKAHHGVVDVNMQLIQSLTKFRSFLLELKANLDA
jgi:DNA-binding transcriptional MerR regulator